jgi:hypothetical protein
MAKAARPKAKESRKPKLSDKAQSERFIEAARELGIEKTGDEFSAAIERIVSRKPPLK